MRIQTNALLAGLVVAATGLLCALPAAAQQNKPVELAYSSWIPPTHVLMKNFMIPWGQEVEKATEGRVKINFLPKAVTNPVGHLDAVRRGAVDLAFVSHSYYPGRFDLMKLPTLPFSGNSAEANSLATWRIYDKYLRAANEHRGVKLLGVYGHGPGGVYTTKTKVEKIEDFKGLKVRIGGGMSADVATALEANAIVKPAPESYELLSTGVVDGVFFPPESVTSFRLDEVIKFATTFPGGLYSDSHGIVMNEKAFERLEPRDRETLMKLSGEHIARMGGKAWGDEDKAALAKLKAAKVSFTEASPKLIADVKARTAKFEQEWLDAAKKAGLDGPKVLADFRAELKRAEAGN
ncbi:TRAP transporter substrate-binding protein [Xenophilus arseniciresistens]|uniref:TRAP transporter substrate-binding protein n=1 Tax=Xenophilus arseniciresistens TaxID=1283306 RepID=A0AAE3NCC2_9BURK|nr:TRAP transporter substrate-binding protein [Xenophilus arseniciresistens]MDA7417732.1 TRAP transporter substrate-binding protein [Xenophilus arseniciresistens]